MLAMPLRLIVAALTAWSLATGLLSVTAAAETGRATTDAVAPTRKPWTTSRVVGSPDPPPPYRAADAFPNLRFEKPVHVTHAPGGDRLFVCQEQGKIFSFPNRREVAKA